jgi:hypothetical protein
MKIWRAAARPAQLRIRKMMPVERGSGGDVRERKRESLGSIRLLRPAPPEICWACALPVAESIFGADPAADLDAGIGSGNGEEPGAVDAANLHVFIWFGPTRRDRAARSTVRPRTNSSAVFCRTATQPRVLPQARTDRSWLVARRNAAPRRIFGRARRRSRTSTRVAARLAHPWSRASVRHDHSGRSFGIAAPLARANHFH